MVKSVSDGFTLIEMLVVVAIMAFLALIAAPFTTAWVDAARVRQSTHRLVEAMAHAKSVALRNGNSVSGDAPSSVLVVADAKLCVYDRVPSKLACNGDAVWIAETSANVALNGQSVQCVALNNLALQVTAVINSVTCGAGSYVVSRGSEKYPSDGSNALN